MTQKTGCIDAQKTQAFDSCKQLLFSCLLIAGYFSLLTMTPVAADELTLERIFSSPPLDGTQPRNLEVAPDGSRVTFLRGKESDQFRLDLWEFNIEDEEVRLLVDSVDILPEEGELSDEEKARRERQRIAQFSGIVNYQWTADASAILFPLGGDVYLYTLAEQGVQRVTESEAFETDAKLSPGGQYVSFIRDQDLFVVNLESGQERALTTDGEGLISNGMPEFVAQEEMDRDTGYWWSPDESMIAWLRVDDSPVQVEKRYEVLGSEIIVYEQRYPAAGTSNAVVTLFVTDVESGETREMPLGADTDYYIPRVNWFPDSEKLAVQRQSRDQKTLELLAFEVSTGEHNELFVENEDTFINLHKDLKFLKQTQGFVWSSERSGFRHLYLYYLNGEVIRQLTRGDWEVTELEAIDESNGWVYFSATRESPAQRHLYRVPLSGGEVELITRRAGTHAIDMSTNGQVFVDSFSSRNQPAQVSINHAGGNRIAWLSENAIRRGHPYAAYLDEHGQTIRGTLPAPDGKEMYWQITQPPGFNPEEQYPVIVYVYGGPTGQLVTDSWGRRVLVEQYWARLGYLVFTVDNRGVEHYGKSFQEPVYKKLGVLDVADQLHAVDWLKQQSHVDPDRIGVFGWSYGGYMVLMMLMQEPGALAAGASVAPVTDWALYDTHYTERYMGTPQDDAEVYRLGDVLTYSSNLEDPLLLIHGMADDNVLFSHTTRLMENLQQSAIPFDLMTYPGGKHSLVGENVRVHVYSQITDFFERHLKP